MNHDPNGYFAEYLRHGASADPSVAKTIADRALLTAIKDCTKFVNGWDDLIQLTGIVKNRLTFIFHEIDDEATVYTVFEVLNSRGFPPNEKAAYEWVADGRDYAKWTTEHVKKRSERLFRKGHPFSPVFASHHNLLFQVKTVRNAIAHDSADAWTKFEEMVRNELKTVPANTTVGSFLLTIKPKTNPPFSFLDFYLREIEIIARKIIPS